MRLPGAWLARLQRPLLVTADRGPHVRDAMSLERAMAVTGIALLPAAVMAVYNTGLQANLVLAGGAGAAVPGWRGAVIGALGAAGDYASAWAHLVHGAVYFLPVLAVAWVVGFGWQSVFAGLRRLEPAPGLAVTALVYALILPPTVPLWQVALGMSFGLVMGREVFGGSGRTFLNPALVGAVFLVISFPSEMARGGAWVAVDGYTGATPLAAARQGLEALTLGGVRWTDAFLGWMPGAFGETSTLACLIGAVVLLACGLASWRVMAAIVLGAWATAEIMAVSVAGNPVAALPAHWHFVIGGFAFGTIFIATDPSSAAMTQAGRWVYGFLIGALVIVIRVANPGHAEGMMFALLLGSIAAPLIDYLVLRLDRRRRARRHAARD